MNTPYRHATSGMKAREATIKVLKRLGASAIGFYDDFENCEVRLQFSHRGRQYDMRVPIKGLAAQYLRDKPYSGRMRKWRSKTDYEQELLRQAAVSVNSAFRESCKGWITMIESRAFAFEQVFLPWMLTADGRTVHERVTQMPGLLPAPEEPKVVPLVGTATK